MQKRNLDHKEKKIIKELKERVLFIIVVVFIVIVASSYKAVQYDWVCYKLKAGIPYVLEDAFEACKGIQIKDIEITTSTSTEAALAGENGKYNGKMNMVLTLHYNGKYVGEEDSFPKKYDELKSILSEAYFNAKSTYETQSWIYIEDNFDLILEYDNVSFRMLDNKGFFARTVDGNSKCIKRKGYYVDKSNEDASSKYKSSRKSSSKKSSSKKSSSNKSNAQTKKSNTTTYETPNWNTKSSKKSKKSNQEMPDPDDYETFEEFMDDWDGNMPDGSDAEEYWEDW